MRLKSKQAANGQCASCIPISRNDSIWIYFNGLSRPKDLDNRILSKGFIPLSPTLHSRPGFQIKLDDHRRFLVTFFSLTHLSRSQEIIRTWKILVLRCKLCARHDSEENCYSKCLIFRNLRMGCPVPMPPPAVDPSTRYDMDHRLSRFQRLQPEYLHKSNAVQYRAVSLPPSNPSHCLESNLVRSVLVLQQRTNIQYTENNNSI